jgi:HPt (histidine-containing phosphotransfer) domain-containing protein
MDQSPGGQTEFIDWETLLRRLDGDRPFLQELVLAFVASQEADALRLRRAISCRDCPAVEHAAHAIKGALQNFVSGEAVRLAYALEVMGREGRLDGAGEACSSLEAELERIVTELISRSRSLK